jgi:hypothetical protein
MMTEVTKDLGINPFVGTLEIGVNIREMKDSYSMADGFLNNTRFTAEVARRVTVYPSKEYKTIVSSLTPMANKLLTWVLNRLKYGEDYVNINHGRFMSDCGIKSYNTYKSALDSLIKNGVLAGTIEKGVYWINPGLFFCGNRANKYPDNLKVLRDDTENLS